MYWRGQDLLHRAQLIFADDGLGCGIDRQELEQHGDERRHHEGQVILFRVVEDT